MKMESRVPYWHYFSFWQPTSELAGCFVGWGSTIAERKPGAIGAPPNSYVGGVMLKD